MESSEISGINKALAASFGKTLAGLPFFRVVWSESELELRKGSFNEFYGPIYLRTYEGVKLVPKYNYIRFRWILEKWNPPWLVQTPELINPNGYEPLYVFESKDGISLPVNLKVCSIIAWNVLNPTMDRFQRKAFIDAMLDKEFKDDVAYFEDRIEDLDNNFRFGLRHGNTILAPEVSKGEIK